MNDRTNTPKRRTMDRRAARRFKSAQLVALIAWGADDVASYAGAIR